MRFTFSVSVPNCKKYKNLISRFSNLDNESKFLYASKNHFRILGNFIVELWSERNNLLFRDCNDIQKNPIIVFLVWNNLPQNIVIVFSGA